ncbi:MAG: efflux RND transporter periplasmic adaptor subunit [Anaerolineales bacterium]|jgi:HlyD family secretion protein
MRRVRWIILVVVLAAIGGGAYWYLRGRNQGSQQANYQTATVTRGSISEDVSASGNVRARQSAEIDWQTSGQVSTIDVQVGQKVQAGQELASLDPTTVSPSVLNAQQTLVTAKQNLQTLQQSTLDTTQAEQTLATAQQNLKTAKNALSALSGPTNADEVTIKQYQADLEIAQAQLKHVQEQYGNLSKIKPTNVHKAQKVLRLTQAEQKVQQAQYNLNWAEGHATNTDIGVAKSNLAVAQSQLADAQRQYDQVKNGPSADDLAAAQAAVDAAQSTLNEVSLTAPFSGTVTEVDILPNDVVSAGTAGFRIDDLSSLYVDVVASEVDINNIQIGQPVQMTFDAVPNKTYNGKVTAIGEVGTSSQGVVNFPVTLQITNADAKVKPGMTAAVSIVVAQHNNVLLVPNQAVRTIGNRHTVTVLYQGQLMLVQVDVGITNNTTTEVTGGQLQEGDTVVLNAPVSASSNGSFRGRPGGGFGGFIP